MCLHLYMQSFYIVAYLFETVLHTLLDFSMVQRRLMNKTK